MTTSSRLWSAADASTASSSGNDGLGALEAEPLLPDVLRLQERLEGLGNVQPTKDVQLLLAGGRLVIDLDVSLDPGPLFGVGDVHVLDADPTAIRVAQYAEDVAQAHQLDAGEAVDREFAIEVPQRQAVPGDVEVGVGADRVLERVGVGHQVAVRTVGVDQLDDAGALVDLALVAEVPIDQPAHRLVGDAQRGEDLVVEVIGQ